MLRQGAAARRFVPIGCSAVPGCLSRSDINNPVEPRFGEEHLALAAKDLAHVGIWPTARIGGREPFGRRVEAENRVGAEVAHPDLIIGVDVDRIGARRDPGSFQAFQVPFAGV